MPLVFGVGAQNGGGDESDSHPGTDQCEGDLVVAGLVGDGHFYSGLGCGGLQGDPIVDAGRPTDPLFVGEVGQGDPGFADSRVSVR